MSPSPHTRRREETPSRKTFYHPDDGVRDADRLADGGTGTIHAIAKPASREAAPAKSGVYVSVRAKFSIAALIATLWAATSLYLAQDWLAELSGHIGLPLAALAIFGIAIAPGFMNAFLLASLALDRRPRRKPLEH